MSVCVIASYVRDRVVGFRPTTLLSPLKSLCGILHSASPSPSPLHSRPVTALVPNVFLRNSHPVRSEEKRRRRRCGKRISRSTPPAAARCVARCAALHRAAPPRRFRVDNEKQEGGRTNGCTWRGKLAPFSSRFCYLPFYLPRPCSLDSKGRFCQQTRNHRATVIGVRSRQIKAIDVNVGVTVVVGWKYSDSDDNGNSAHSRQTAAA